jgi:hypothetical protein
MTEFKVLGLDPGVTTGYGIMTMNEETKRISVVEFGTTKDQTLEEIGRLFHDVNLVVSESFLVRPPNARKGAFDWDPLQVIQVIGAMKLQCRLAGLQFVEQSASIKPVGYGFLRQKYVKGKKDMHMWDALAHAAFYLVRHKGAKPLGL